MKQFISFLVRHVPRPWLIRFSYVFSAVIRPFLSGNQVECPVCGGQFRKFLPYGVKGRSNVLCPKCLSLERHRLIWLFLLQKTDFFTTHQKMLHIAPEQSFLKRFRQQEQLDYTTADLVSPLADLKLDIQDMPLSDNQYDIVMCNHVMEHIDDDRQAMREVLRVLKPGGLAILFVPMDMQRHSTYENPEITAPLDREKHFLQKDHVRLYGLDYPERLQEVGFEVTTHDLRQELGHVVAERYRLAKDEVVYEARKPV